MIAGQVIKEQMEAQNYEHARQIALARYPGKGVKVIQVNAIFEKKSNNQKNITSSTESSTSGFSVSDKKLDNFELSPKQLGVIILGVGSIFVFLAYTEFVLGVAGGILGAWGAKKVDIEKTVFNKIKNQKLRKPFLMGTLSLIFGSFATFGGSKIQNEIGFREDYVDESTTQISQSEKNLSDSANKEISRLENLAREKYDNGDYLAAIEVYKLAINYNTKNADLYNYYIARIYWDKFENKIDLSLNHVKKAVNLESQIGDYHYLLATLLYEKNKVFTNEACQSLKKAFDLGYVSEEMQSWLKSDDLTAVKCRNNSL